MGVFCLLGKSYSGPAYGPLTTYGRRKTLERLLSADIADVFFGPEYFLAPMPGTKIRLASL